MNDLTSLLTTSFNSTVDVCAIGRQVAAKYLADGSPLNDSIAEHIKESSLNSEQLRRVVEEANKQTFAGLFKRGNYGKNVEFPVADFTKLCMAKESAKRSLVAGTTERTKTASVNRLTPKGGDLLLSGLFGSDIFKEKVAAVVSPEVLMTNNVTKLAALREDKKDIGGKHYAATEEFNTKFFKLGTLIKSASLQHGAAIVAAALAAGKPTAALAELIKEAFAVDPAMAPPPGQMQQAGMEVVQGNPVTGLVQDLDQVVNKLFAARTAMQKVDEGIFELQAVLKGSGPPTEQVFAQSAPPPPPDPSQPEVQQPGPGAQYAPA